ncbi:MAG: hypothetical protein U0528_07080 [Anaerolineae bacterium]
MPDSPVTSSCGNRFFIGKSPYVAREIMRDAVIARFRLESRGVRPPITARH